MAAADTMNSPGSVGEKSSCSLNLMVSCNADEAKGVGMDKGILKRDSGFFSKNMQRMKELTKQIPLPLVKPQIDVEDGTPPEFKQAALLQMLTEKDSRYKECFKILMKIWNSQIFSFLKQMFLVILLLASFAQSVTQIRKYLSKPYSTDIKLAEISASDSPWITICLDPILNLKAYERADMIAYDGVTTDPFASPYPSSALNVFSIQRYMRMFNCSLSQAIVDLTTSVMYHRVMCFTPSYASDLEDTGLCDVVFNRPFRNREEFAKLLEESTEPIVHSFAFGDWETELFNFNFQEVLMCSTFKPKNLTLSIRDTRTLRLKIMPDDVKTTHNVSSRFLKAGILPREKWPEMVFHMTQKFNQPDIHHYDSSYIGMSTAFGYLSVEPSPRNPVKLSEMVQLRLSLRKYQRVDSRDDDKDGCTMDEDVLRTRHQKYSLISKLRQQSLQPAIHQPSCLSEEDLSAASQLLMTFREHTLDSPFDPEEFRVSAAAVLYYSGLYDSATFNYDFALVQLALPVPITGLSNIRPVCLASQSFDFNGYTGIPIGWGVYENGVGRQASVLRETTVSICNRAACLNSGGVPSSTSICGFTRGRGICFGDSGGPMTVKSAGKHYFAGFPVATHPGTAPNTCDTNKPQYYTQATFFTNVITQYAWVFGNYCSY
ncbi:unnamed protein product [Notodromas monacha]|uniref:Peptidase S1 domain-containing protein n=1 Tax=Notodromas monacha TaxID=399045 RepID=A0A7R9BQL9_9CRUS|nr:unnamed protein product [Notodromas monacha]CAG0918782.1 unnamed protein product [Notodromas monacha]